jgi:DNA polymerase-4
MSGKVIFHLDMDQFFAAVEQLHHPELRGKPIAVGGSTQGHGVVTTASYEARRYGICSGMSAADALKLCPHVIFVRPDTDKYLDVSHHVFQLLMQYTDRVEPVSVDEAYLDVTDVVWKEGGVDALAMTIKRRIRESEHITATIGAGPNRVVAKMACGMHKPDGYTYIPAEKVAEVFHDLPVGDLCGVGRATERVLRELGVCTIGQLAAFPADILRPRLGKWADELVRNARGEGNDEVLLPGDHPQEKSMSHEHTFSMALNDSHLLLGRIHLLCERVARRLRTAKLIGRCVSVKLRYNKGFETILHGHKLKHFVQHEMDIYPVAEKLFHQSYRTGQMVRLVGVQVSELISTAELLQQELFIGSDEPDHLSQACDEIKDRYGERAIGFASGVFFNAGRGISNSRRVNEYRPFHQNL